MTLDSVKRVTMRDIAQAANVPVSSVALALNNKPGVSATRRDAVLAAAKSMGYLQNRAPRSPVLGLLVEDLRREAKLDGFIDSIVQGVYAEARALDLHVILSVYHPQDDPLARLRELTGRDIDGMILTNGGDITTDVVQRILAADTPAVLVENYVTLPVDAVVADNFNAGFTCTRHLIELGHTRIALLSGSPRYISLTDRARGHVAALWESGIELSHELMPPQPDSSAQKGYLQTSQLLDLPNPPTAIYAVSDASARGAYQAILERGLRIGVDVSVVGTDNVEESAFRSPPLTTFDVRARALGEEAVRVISGRLSASRDVARITVPGSLILRSSSAPPF